jgi:hypothetical protein
LTDTNGNYSASVSSSFWKIKPSKERLARRAYITSDANFQVDTTAGDVTNANIALPKGNALFYGRVTDNSNAPLANLEVDGGSSLDDSKGYTDQNGYYSVAILGDQTNYWACSLNDGKNTVLARYVFNTFNGQTFTPGQTVLQNFIGLPTIGSISGHVQDNSGNPVTGVALSGNANISGNNYQTLDSTTDNSGNYSLAVATGQWNVEFLEGNSSDNLDAHGYADLTAPHIVSIPPTNATLNIIVYPLGTPTMTAPQRFSSTQFGFNLNGVSNVTYTVQVSTNLASTNWASLFSLILTNNPFPVVDTQATNGQRFYRVLKN